MIRAAFPAMAPAPVAPALGVALHRTSSTRTGLGSATRPSRPAQALWVGARLAAVLLTGCSAHTGDKVVSAHAPLAELELGAGVTLRREFFAAVRALEASLVASGLEWTIYMDMAPTAGAEDPPGPPPGSPVRERPPVRNGPPSGRPGPGPHPPGAGSQGAR